LHKVDWSFTCAVNHDRQIKTMRVDNTSIAISKTTEAAFNTPETDDPNFVDLPTTEPFFILPKLEKVSNAVRIGRNAPTHLCNTYWTHSEITIKDDIETGVPAMLSRRAVGGTDNKTTVAAGVYDHEVAILPPAIGDILPSFNIAAILGAADYLLAGLMVDKVKFSQKGADRAQYEANILGSGKFSNPAQIEMPSQTDTECMDGYKTVVKYTDVNASVINLTSLGTVIEWMIEHDNKIRRNKRRQGDPVIAVGTGKGAHVRSQPRGKYETKGSLTLDFNDLTYWTKSVKNEKLTNLKFTVQGPLIANVGGIDYFHEFEIIVPSFGFDSPDTGDDEGDAATPINIVPFEDPITKGTFKLRVRNGSNSLLV